MTKQEKEERLKDLKAAAYDLIASLDRETQVVGQSQERTARIRIRLAEINEQIVATSQEPMG